MVVVILHTIWGKGLCPQKPKNLPQTPGITCIQPHINYCSFWFQDSTNSPILFKIWPLRSSPSLPSPRVLTNQSSQEKQLTYRPHPEFWMWKVRPRGQKKSESTSSSWWRPSMTLPALQGLVLASYGEGTSNHQGVMGDAEMAGQHGLRELVEGPWGACLGWKTWDGHPSNP